MQYNKKFELHYSKNNKDKANTYRVINYENITYYINKDKNETLSSTSYRTTSLEANINQLSLTIPATINYSFSMSHFHPYVGIGVGVNFNLAQNKDFVYRDYNQDYDGKFPAFMAGYLVKTGAIFNTQKSKSIWVEISFERFLSIAQVHDHQQLHSWTYSITGGIPF